MKTLLNLKPATILAACVLCGAALALTACVTSVPAPGAGQAGVLPPAATAFATPARALGGTYKATTPAADAPSLTRTLDLLPDGTALLTTEYQGKPGNFVERGSWSVAGTLVKVILTDNNGRAEQNAITFELRVDTLVAITYDQNLYGSAGLQLKRVMVMAPQPAGTGVNEDALRNGQYRLPDIGTFRLTDGNFTYSYGSGATQVNKVGYLNSAQGDLNGDGKPDAVAILWANTGGSGNFVYIVAVLDQGGQVSQVAAEMLGDRIQVQQLAVKDGQIVANVNAFAPGDPQCCPSTRVTRTYVLDGTTLKVISEVKPTAAPIAVAETRQPQATVPAAATAVATRQPSTAQAATPAPARTATSAPAALSEAGLKNAAYQLPDVGAFQLKDGSFELKYGDGATQVYRVTYLQGALGDLNGDKITDGVAILSLNSGGTGQFRYLVVMVMAGGKPLQITGLELGDRTQINAVSIQNGDITLDMLAHGPNDPLCCPSQAVKQMYRLQGDTLIALQ